MEGEEDSREKGGKGGKRGTTKKGRNKQGTFVAAGNPCRCDVYYSFI